MWDKVKHYFRNYYWYRAVRDGFLISWIAIGSALGCGIFETWPHHTELALAIAWAVAIGLWLVLVIWSGVERIHLVKNDYAIPFQSIQWIN